MRRDKEDRDYYKEKPIIWLVWIIHSDHDRDNNLTYVRRGYTIEVRMKTILIVVLHIWALALTDVAKAPLSYWIDTCVASWKPCKWSLDQA